jgi:uncharacterized membrane protein
MSDILTFSKTTAYPVPGVKVNGRQLFLEIKTMDTEKTMKELAEATAEFFKTSCDLRNDVKYKKQFSCDKLDRVIIQ